MPNPSAINKFLVTAVVLCTSSCIAGSVNDFSAGNRVTDFSYPDFSLGKHMSSHVSHNKKIQYYDHDQYGFISISYYLPDSSRKEYDLSFDREGVNVTMRATDDSFCIEQESQSVLGRNTHRAISCVDYNTDEISTSYIVKSKTRYSSPDFTLNEYEQTSFGKDIHSIQNVMNGKYEEAIREMRSSVFPPAKTMIRLGDIWRLACVRKSLKKTLDFT